MYLTNNEIALGYLVAGVLIILSLNRLSRPATARMGNALAIAGMVIAILATLLNPAVKSYGLIVAGIGVGGVIGTTMAFRLKMTSVPQLVALLHSFVGLAAVLIAVGIYLGQTDAGTLSSTLMIELAVASSIGAITFTGSLMAFGKLQTLISTKPIIIKGRHLLNLVLGGGILFFAYSFFVQQNMMSLLLLIGFALALGVLLILPIGGPDMPVIISMLNSYSGWAAAATGFTLGNPLLIMTGALVGCSGAILSYIMCRAMNRTLIHVVLGGIGHSRDRTPDSYATSDKPVQTAAVEDAVFAMENARSVIIVPGYGMAVAQAQQAVKELVKGLEAKGVDVKFGIHPVAGRMPGHMNVLLAEADISYDTVFAMEEINPEFANTDVVLVIGANDVTNPAAKEDQSSPIYGMPILEVSRAQHTFFIKRSLNPGYSGVDNQLFYKKNCSLIFGDAKVVCQQMANNLLMAA